MALKLLYYECASCGRRTGHVKQKPSHAFHLIMTGVTMGIWAIVWIACAYDLSEKRAVCLACGSEDLRQPQPQSAPSTHSSWDNPSSRAPEGSAE